MSKDPQSIPATQPKTATKPHDDVIHVPKGTSRARFLLTALLVVLVLTTFTVTGPLMDLLTGKSRAMNAYMTWRHPDGRVQAVSGSDFLLQKRSLSNVLALLRGGRSQRETDDAAAARHFLTDGLAKDAGVVVTDDEVSERILAMFGSADVYRRQLANYRMSATEFEGTIRSLMRVERFQILLAEGLSLPDPDKVVERWKKMHEERSIQTIELPTERFAAEAEAAVPAEAELRAWFDALPEPQKSTYRVQVDAKTSAEVAWFSLDPPTKIDRLLAGYPRPEGEDPDEVARNWYEANKDLLYKKPGLAPGVAPGPDGYRPFEEVQESARHAGLAYQSISDWFQAFQIKEVQEGMASLSEDAVRLGLAYRREDALHTAAEWPTAAMYWQSQRPIEAMFQPSTQAGKLVPEVIIDPKALFVIRITQKHESRMPEFAEYADKVRAAWIEQKKGELARAKLEELAAKFATEAEPLASGGTIHVEADGDKFQAAAKELGLEVVTQEWMDLTARTRPADQTPLLLSVRRFGMRHGAKLGAISNPETSPDGKTAWMMRTAGQRDADPARMAPADYENAELAASYESRQTFIQQTFQSDDFLKRQYGLQLQSWREAEEKEKGSPAPQQ